MTNGELEFNNRPFVKHRDNRADREDFVSNVGRNQYRQNFGGRDNNRGGSTGGRDNRSGGAAGGRDNRGSQGGTSRNAGGDNRNNNNRNFKKRY